MSATPIAPASLVVASCDQLRDLLREIVADELAARSVEPVPAPLAVAAPEMCRLLSVSRTTLHRMRVEGMPTLHVGDTYRYEPLACLEWFRSRHARAK